MILVGLLQQTNFHKLNRLILSKFTVVCIVFCLSILPVFLLQDYYSSRFSLYTDYSSLGEASSNISYLSGLGRAYLSLLQFPNLGLGYVFSRWPYLPTITSALLRNNLYHSQTVFQCSRWNFMASKMCVEFGYLGLAITVLLPPSLLNLCHSRRSLVRFVIYFTATFLC